MYGGAPKPVQLDLRTSTQQNELVSMPMNHFPRIFTVIVLAHLVVAIVHGWAHQSLMIGLTTNQQLFIIVVIIAAPLVAMVLSWTQAANTSATLLGLSMLGSLVFGLVNHYVIASPDHVSHLPAGTVALVFKVTAALLAITEVLGSLVGWRALQRLRD